MIRSFTVFILLLFLLGCAQVREVSGGPKDTAAPELVESEPPHLSTGFTGQRIVLRFNERVKVADLRKQLLISPPLPEMPDVHVQGGTDVVIDLKAPLAEATTYSFNLGLAVKDMTEGNSAADLVYVVSTGDHLDSCTVSGIVLDARTGKPAAALAVLLLSAADSTGFRTGRPAYATRTDEQGHYTLDHLRNGAYRLFALGDQNANLRFDLPNEEIAFLSDLVELPDTLPKPLQLFREAPAVQVLMDQRVGPDRDWKLVLAKPASALTLRVLDQERGRLTWTMDMNAARDTAHCWPNDTTALDGVRFELGDGSTVLDTVTYRVRERMPYNLTADLSTDGQRLRVRSSRPLASVDPQRITVLLDSNAQAITVALDTVDGRSAILDLTEALSGMVRVDLLPKALLDIYGGTNDTLHLSSAQPRPDQLGTLALTLDVDSFAATGPWLVQLLDVQDRAVRTLGRTDLQDRITLPGLAPGSYGLKLVQDRDGKREQDTGELASGLQPERAWRFPGTLVIRAGWEVEQTWEPANP